MTEYKRPAVMVSSAVSSNFPAPRSAPEVWGWAGLGAESFVLG